MTYTDQTDLYGAIDEDGLNQSIEHAQRKRPSLFNYATSKIADNPEDLLCRPIDAVPEVTDNGNPLVTRQDPIPVIGTDGLIKLEYGFQIPTVVIDFAPGDELTFPEDTDLTIDEQEFGIGVGVCAGLACPSEEQMTELVELLRRTRNQPDLRAEIDDPIVPTPRRENIHCFCLFAFVVGEVEMGQPGVQTPTFKIAETPQFELDRVAIAGGNVETDESIARTEDTASAYSSLELPAGLRRSMECYLEMTLELGVLPNIADAVAQVVPRLVKMLEDMFDLAGTTLEVSAPTLAHNPAIQEDELQLRIDATVRGPNS